MTLDQTIHLLKAITHPQETKGDRQARLISLGEWLFDETGGQPFYLVETLKDLVSRQVLTVRATPEGERLALDPAALHAIPQQNVLPPGVRRLILSQVDRLSPTGHALLMAGAILGQASPFDLICRVADLEERDALTALEEVLQYGLLRTVSQEEGQGAAYLIGHDKVREVIATEMGEAKRQFLHRRALEVLEAEARPAAELAQHALETGLNEQAVHFCVTAGDDAVRLFANAEAQLHYSQALEVLAELPETAATQQTRLETILKLVQVSWMAVDVERTLERLAQAEALAQALHDQRQLAHTHYWIGVVYGTRTSMRQARAYAERVLAEAQALGDEELVALASVQLGRALVLQGEYGPVEGLMTPIIPALEQAGNWVAWTDAVGHLGVALAAQGQVAAGIAEGQRAVERARQSGEIESHIGIKARHFLSIVYLYSGDLRRMLAENDQVVQAAQQIGDWLMVYWAYGFRSFAQGRLGLYADALQSLASAQDAGNRLGKDVMGEDILEAVTAELLLATGEVDAALSRAEAAIELARTEVGGLLSEGMARQVCGLALVRLGRWEEAEAQLAASIETLLSWGSRLEAARTHVAWGWICYDRGDRTNAQAHFEQAAAQYDASGLTQDHETVQRYLDEVRVA